jgi:hypothetical protein
MGVIIVSRQYGEEKRKIDGRNVVLAERILFVGPFIDTHP